jgi:FMN phosphatase YigB (HAD superfamily)
MKKIKNIIFDLGGVLLSIDYLKTEKAFVDLGVQKFADLYSQQSASSLFEHLETGAITNQEFYQQFRNAAQVELKDSDIEMAWCSMLGSFPMERLSWLEEIGFRYNIYLFSNTNRIHYEVFQKIFREQTGRENFDDYFVKAWYSHDLGARKPYPEAYTKLLEIEKLKADETLFIDDSEVNIIGAKKAGLQTIWLQAPQTVLDLGL